MLWQFGDPEFQPGGENRNADERFEGVLHTGVMAVGGETTGTVLERADGNTCELDFGKNTGLRQLAGTLNGKKVVVTGKLVSRPGLEVKQRHIVEVQELRENQ
jgi:hypothetical protein